MKTAAEQNHAALGTTGNETICTRRLRTMWAHIFGAICRKKGKSAGLVLPYCDTEAMQ
jgi:putative transposase